MTLKHDIVKLYHRRKIISCCSVSYQEYLDNSDSLDIRVNGEWVSITHLPQNNHNGDGKHQIHIGLSRDTIANYKYYSHSYSPGAMQRYFPKIYEKIALEVDEPRYKRP